MKKTIVTIVILALSSIGCEFKKTSIDCAGTISFVDSDSFLIGGDVQKNKTVYGIWFDFNLMNEGVISGLRYGSEISNDYARWPGAVICPNVPVDSEFRTIKWECTTVTGEDGTVTINSQEFSLEKGPLFLVHTQNGVLEIDQLDIDISRCRAREDFVRLVESNPVLQEFVQNKKQDTKE